MSENGDHEFSNKAAVGGAFLGLALFFIAVFFVWPDKFYFPMVGVSSEKPTDDTPGNPTDRMFVPVGHKDSDEREDKTNGWFIAFIALVASGTVGKFVGGFLEQLGKNLADKVTGSSDANATKKEADGREEKQTDEKRVNGEDGPR